MVRFSYCMMLLVFLLSSPGVQAEDRAKNKENTALSPVNIEAHKTLDLRAAIQMALGQNPTLAAAQERVEQARAVMRGAKASYWPQVNFSSSATRLTMSENSWQQASASAKFFDPSETVTDPESLYSSTLGANWLLFDGFARKYANVAARYAEKESEHARMDSQRLLVSAVAMAYYSAQLARENIAIAKADQSFNQKQMAEAKARRRVGTGSLSDVLNFTIQANGAKAALLSASQDHEISMSGLAALLGRDSAFPASVDVSVLHGETQSEMLQPDLEPLLEIALKSRPDILQKQLSVERSEANTNGAQAAYYPTLSLAAGLDGSRTHDMNYGRDDFGNSLSLSLSYNLFDGGAKRAKISEAHAQKRAAAKEVSALGLRVRAEVRESLIRLETAQEQLQLQRENSGLVQQNRDLVQKEFAAGQASLVRLNEAQRDLTRVKGKLALAIVLVRQSWQEMAIAIGRDDPTSVTALLLERSPLISPLPRQNR